MLPDLRIPYFVACALLLWALVPVNPYGYYIFLRVVIFTFCAYLAVTFQKADREQFAVWVCVGLAILYNPFFKLHLGRTLWGISNCLGVLIFISFYRISEHERNTRR